MDGNRDALADRETGSWKSTLRFSTFYSAFLLSIFKQVKVWTRLCPTPIPLYSDPFTFMISKFFKFVLRIMHKSQTVFIWGRGNTHILLSSDKIISKKEKQVRTTSLRFHTLGYLLWDARTCSLSTSSDCN